MEGICSRPYFKFINQKQYVLVEFVAAFLLLPVLAFLGMPKPAIFGVGLAYTALIYPSLPAPVRPPNFNLMLKRFLFLMSMAFCLLLAVDSNMVAIVIRHEPARFLLTIPLYSLLSVIPQEFIYRRFFFKRYEKYIPEGILFVINIFVFSYAHIGCRNVYAIALTIIAGGVFAETYMRTRNFWLVCFEHAVYGLITFAMGWGYHFS